MLKERANIVVVSSASHSHSANPFTLGILQLITHDDFWADATGGYRGPTRFTGDYRAKLQGATIVMSFSLKHRHIGTRSADSLGCNTYDADTVVKMRVVAPSQPQIVLPARRKACSY